MRPIGFVRHNGCGEIIFRQSGHPSYDDALMAVGWTPVYLEDNSCGEIVFLKDNDA